MENRERKRENDSKRAKEKLKKQQIFTNSSTLKEESKT